MKQVNRKSELSEWVKRYTKDLLIWALGKTSDHQLAEDLVQETFLAAAESLNSFRGDSQPKTWLLGILKNKIAGHYRNVLKKGVGTPLPEEDLAVFFKTDGHWHKTTRPQGWQGEPEHLTNIPAFNQILNTCIQNLPETMSACIRLKFLDERKGEEICQELGISDTNYWQLIRRAKLKLRDCLEKYWFKKLS